jgi:N-acetylmuramoyl-L-alanine amidase
MNIITSRRSPNFTDLEISVEFAVLHYTATSLERTLEIFTDPTREASAHLVIDCDGTVYELVPCLDGGARRAWHAGKSRMEVPINGDSRIVEGFNDLSIGIELVNLNGNIFSYTEAQYGALFSVIERLKARYPALKRPDSIVGHEQISGFRGKCDPGIRFEWERLFAVCYPNQGTPRRASVCRRAVAEKISGFARGMGIKVNPSSGEVEAPTGLPASFFEHLNSLVEAALSRDDI